MKCAVALLFSLALSEIAFAPVPNAFAGHIATLNGTSFAGHTDWQVPNVKELESITNYQNFTPAVSPAFNNNCTSSCTVLTCGCTTSSSGY